MQREIRRAYHVARTDFIARFRSRKLLVFLAVVVYAGYLLNTGTLGLVFTTDDETILIGELTSAMVGLNAAVAGSTTLVFGGFYLMRGTLERDARHGHAPIITSSTISDRVYLLGKLLSNVGVGVATAVVLAGATLVNHIAFGVGPTDPVVIVWPVLVATIPLSVLVGSLALLFGTIDRLSGTFGRIVYFFGVVAVLSLATARPASTAPADLSFVLKGGDFLGMTVSYTLTYESMQAALSGFDGSTVGFGAATGTVKSFSYDGGVWPVWFFLQRAGTVLVGGGVLIAAAATFDRFRDGEDGSPAADDKGGGILPGLPSVSIQIGESETAESSTTSDEAVSSPHGTVADSVSLTSVESRDASGFIRILRAELRRLLRGHPRWWYLGAVVLALLPTVSVGDGRLLAVETVLPVALGWPVFVWSRMGSQTARTGIINQIRSSKYPVKQLLAEWLAGCLIAVFVTSGSFTLLAASGDPSTLIGFVGAVTFPPSLALTAGLWTGSPRLFETLYLGILYVGPLNRVYLFDFAGVVPRSTAEFVPVAFAVAGLLGVVAAIRRRRVYGGVLG